MVGIHKLQCLGSIGPHSSTQDQEVCHTNIHVYGVLQRINKKICYMPKILVPKV